MSKPFIIIDLDRPRKLRFSANALALMEELLGRATPEIAKDLQLGHWGFREMRAMLYAGLQEDDPDLNLRRTGVLMDLKELDYVVSKLGEAFNAAFAKGGDEEAGKNVMAAGLGSGIGEISSGSPPPAASSPESSGP